MVQGNNVYSPNTCSLVTHYANTIFQRRGIETNIVWNSASDKYDASVCILGKTKEIGTFNSRGEAEKTLFLYRKELIAKFARRNRNKIPYKIYEAMMNWNTERAS